MRRSAWCAAAAALFALLPAQTPPVATPPVAALGGGVDAAFTDLRWQRRRLAELGAGAATVVFFATVECPVVPRYLPKLGRLAADYAGRGVVVLVVYCGADDLLVDAAAQLLQSAPAAVFGKDFDGRFAAACGVDRTGTALVLDREHRLRYRGRVDDQYAYTGARAEPSREDLRLALDAVLAGAAVEVDHTEASGCRLEFPTVRPGPAPTYWQDVEPLVREHCAGCHRPGGAAPFALGTEAQVRKHAAMAAEVTQQGRMPLWYGSSAQSFANHLGLPAAARSLFGHWLAAGAPSGTPPAVPPPAAAPAPEWRIGTPDQVLMLKAPVRLPAEGTVPYHYFVLPFRFDHDTWVEALEIKPQNPRVLHHCNLARVVVGEKFSQDGFITGYVPGGDPMLLDPGTAVRIPAGSVLALQAHYITTGEPEQDRLQVGLRFPRVPVQRELQVAIAADFRFEIPPGARAHPVRAARTLPDDAIGIGMFVHMHLRGRDMVVTAESADGGRETLLAVPNYNFDWQQSYRWARGERRFAKGTRIRALAHFDNSAWNPFNPDPTVPVKFGLETTDEMMYLFLFWERAGEQLGLQVDPGTGRVVGG
jgi:hypothetical protein